MMKYLDLNKKLWLFAGACIGLTLFFLVQFYTKDISEYKEEKERLSSLVRTRKAQLAKIMTQEKRKGKLKEQIKNAEKEFRQLKAMFPDRDFIPKRLQDITRASRRAFVVPISFRPLKIEKKDFYQENQYEIKVASSYHGLGTFFEEIANFIYPTSISQVTISQNTILQNPEGDIQLNETTNTTITRFQLKTFTSHK